MPDQEKQTGQADASSDDRWSPVLVVAAEETLLVRAALRSECSETLERLWTLFLAHEGVHEDLPDSFEMLFARLERARALVVLFGWEMRETGTVAVEVDMFEHRDSLIEALITHVDVERKLLPFTVFGDPERTATRERIQTMEDMIAKAQASEHTIVIDGTVVRLLRTGSYASLGLAADDLSARTSPAGRETDPDVYRLPLKRLDDIRALLDLLGWCRVEPERQIELEVGQHRAALIEAARIALDTSEDAEPANRPAIEHIQGLRELVEHLAG